MNVPLARFGKLSAGGLTGTAMEEVEEAGLVGLLVKRADVDCVLLGVSRAVLVDLCGVDFCDIGC